MYQNGVNTGTVSIAQHDLGGASGLFVIVGPCVIESEQLVQEVASEVARIHKNTGVPMIFKSSFDKANRTSIDSFRGPGLHEGLRILAGVRQSTGLPVTSDIHTPDQARPAGEVLDLIQIPAFLSRQTDLLVAAGNTGKPINIKKGQFLSPEDMAHAVAKVTSTGNSNILLTERGSGFGYHNLVVDMRSIVQMKRFGYPVVFDATHSAQLPSAGEACSAGDRSLVAPLARAAVGAGTDGLFMEVHPDPESALCDGPNSLALHELEPLVKNLMELYALIPRENTVGDRGPVEARDAETNGISLEERMKKIELLIFDIDGALTDGRITLGSGDLELKSFHVRDGHGIKLARRTGLEMAFVTGRISDIVERRAREVGITLVYQDIKDKKPVLEQLVHDLDLDPEQVAMLGDDVVDIPIFRRIGLAVAVPDAPREVTDAAHFITRRPGGRGAARELIDMILKAKGTWSDVTARYYK